jgi:DNA-binding LytR/AlgR family response regulator
MRIAICDDRTEDRDLLKKYCENLGYLDLSLFSSGKDLLESSLLSTIDLVFLDIEMQGYSGIEVKNILESNYPATLIVFCTTHSELMVDAFGKNVLSFLTKPYDEHMIQQSLGHASALAKDILSVSIAEGCKISSKDIVYFHS